MTPPILPFVHAQGSWGDIGYQIGQMAAPAIERHLDAWTRHVMRETGCPRDAVEAAAAPFASPIQEHAPFLWEELEGMSRGSGLPVARLLILQARAEVMRANSPPAPAPALECTTFGATGRRTADGVTRFGQNVDLVPLV